MKGTSARDAVRRALKKYQLVDVPFLSEELGFSDKTIAFELRLLYGSGLGRVRVKSRETGGWRTGYTFEPGRYYYSRGTRRYSDVRVWHPRHRRSRIPA